MPRAMDRQIDEAAACGTAAEAGGIMSGPTMAQVQAGAARRLAAAGVASPGLDARLLLGLALGVSQSHLIGHRDSGLDERAVTAFEALVARRAAGEPVARIVGAREFWSLRFELSAATLEPRPDSETLVEAALRYVRQSDRTAPLIADLGTGTGCVLVALLHEIPQARGVAVDISAEALTTARRNAARHGVVQRAAFVRGDYSSALGGGFDVVVSNPPYIASQEIDALAAEVADHDPRLALDGGADGLDAYRAIAADAARVLRPGGAIFLEVGEGQAQAVAKMFDGAGLRAATKARIVRDLAGCERVVALTRGR